MKLKYLALPLAGLFAAFFCLLLLVALLFASDEDGGRGGIYYGGANLSAEVLAHRPMVERYAAQYGISPQRIAVGGFSAGAHLAGLHAAVWNRASWYPQGTDLALHQPNAAVLCYPVVSAGEYAHRGSFEQLAGDDMEKQQAFSLETLVSPDMPRTFLWHTLTDETVPVENSLLLEKSLRRAGVSHEMHLFPHGVHGLALADMETSDIEKGRLPDRHIARWQALCAEWLKE